MSTTQPNTADAEVTRFFQGMERFARADPGQFKFRVIMLAALGYIYLTLLLAVAVAILTGLVLLAIYVFKHANTLAFAKAMKGLLYIGIPVLIFSFSILSSLFMVIVRLFCFRIPSPPGLTLHRGMAPKLFAMVNELRTQLNAPQIDTILLDPNFNAGVIQIPRHGLFGGSKNFLLLGLPLMQAVSPEQFKAVIAHELGHVAGNHGRFRLWVHNVWMTWASLIASFGEEGGGSGLIRGFFRWYAPYLYFHDFILGRACEYDADRSAKRFVGPEHTAELLINMTVASRQLDEVIFPALGREAKAGAQTANSAMSWVCEALRRPVSPVRACLWVQEALDRPTDYSDVHPCLSERLRMLGYDPQHPEGDPSKHIPPLPQPQPPEQSAAEFYLGSTLGKAIKYLDKIVQVRVAA